MLETVKDDSLSATFEHMNAKYLAWRQTVCLFMLYLTCEKLKAVEHIQVLQQLLNVLGLMKAFKSFLGTKIQTRIISF